MISVASDTPFLRLRNDDTPPADHRLHGVYIDPLTRAIAEMRVLHLMVAADSSLAAAGVEAALDGVPDVALQRDAVEAVDLLQAGRRGDVDLGQVVADHVDADEDQAALGQRRADQLADLALAGGQGRLLGAAADMQVGARLARRRHPVDRPGGHAVDQDDALVALADFRQVALDDQRLAIELGEQLEDRVQVVVLGRDVEDAGAAVAEQRLDDDIALLAAEGDDVLAAAGDEGWRQQ